MRSGGAGDGVGVEEPARIECDYGRESAGAGGEDGEEFGGRAQVDGGYCGGD